MVAISIFAAFVCSVKLLAKVIHNGAIRYTFGGYKAPYGIEFYIDSIGAIIVLINSTLRIYYSALYHEF